MPQDESFFDRLLGLLELERAEERSRLAELKRTLTLGERESRGLALLDLEIREERVGLGGRFLLSLERYAGPLEAWPA